MNPRYQRGQQIPIALVIPSRSDSLPTATITDPSNALLGTVLALPFLPGYIPASFTYSTTIRLPGGAELGTYQVSFAYTVAGVPLSSTYEFDAVAGGDSGGEVIAMFDYSRPEARYLLVQLATGKLVQGRNPHL